MVFVKKCNISHVFLSGKIVQENLFHDILGINAMNPLAKTGI